MSVKETQYRRVGLLQKQNTSGLTASERLELEELNVKVDQEIHKTLGPINEKLSEFAQRHHSDADFDRVERVSQIREFFETDWENAERLTDFFDG